MLRGKAAWAASGPAGPPQPRPPYALNTYDADTGARVATTVVPGGVPPPHAIVPDCGGATPAWLGVVSRMAVGPPALLLYAPDGHGDITTRYAADALPPLPSGAAGGGGAGLLPDSVAALRGAGRGVGGGGQLLAAYVRWWGGAGVRGVAQTSVLWHADARNTTGGWTEREDYVVGLAAAA
jgi:hypothetical protein